MPMVRIGEALIALGFINEAQLDEALEQQRSDRSVPLGELLVRKGLVSRADLQTALARKMGYPLVDVTQFPVETEALRSCPTRWPAGCRRCRCCCATAAWSWRWKTRRAPTCWTSSSSPRRCKVVPVLARASLLPAAVVQGLRKHRRGHRRQRRGRRRPRRVRHASDTGKLLETLERSRRREPRTDDEPRSSSPTTRWCG